MLALSSSWATSLAVVRLNDLCLEIGLRNSAALLSGFAASDLAGVGARPPQGKIRKIFCKKFPIPPLK